jgi:hypothetical protein
MKDKLPVRPAHYQKAKRRILNRLSNRLVAFEKYFQASAANCRKLFLYSLVEKKRMDKSKAATNTMYPNMWG